MYVVSASTPSHTNTHTEDCLRLWLAQNTTHAGVITMQVDYSNYCVMSSFYLFFFLPSKWQTLLVGLEFFYWLWLTSQLQPHPLTPWYLYEGPKMFQSLVFYVYPSNVRNGGCKCHWLGLSLCSVWHSETCEKVSRLMTCRPRFLIRRLTAHKQARPESDLHSAAHFHQQYFTIYWDCFEYCYIIYVLFSWQLWSFSQNFTRHQFRFHFDQEPNRRALYQKIILSSSWWNSFHQ